MIDASVDPVVGPVIPLLRARSESVGDQTASSRPRRPLPLAQVPLVRTNPTVYGMAAMDCCGRLTDRVVFGSLGWSPGQRLSLDEHQGMVVCQAASDGVACLTGRGHQRLPALLRHRCGLRSGDRVLLVADPRQQRLLVLPLAVLDSLVAACQADPVGGDPA